MLKESKPNLVIAAVGDESLHRHWMPSASNSYDVALVYYGDGEGYKSDCKFYREEKGPKYHLLQNALKQPSLMNYKYIWLPDDDIHATPADLDRMFEHMKFFNLSLSQPSIMGWYSLDITLHQKGSLLRFVNFVEIMCPCFSSEALAICLDTFKENTTGWSYDALWNVKLGQPRRSIAIIDDVVVFHTRPVFSGDLYQNCNMKNPERDAGKEGGELFKKHNLRKVDRDINYGTPIKGAPLWAVVYEQISKPMEENIPKPKRFWPPNLEDFVKGLRG
jgi:hypothetical protein